MQRTSQYKAATTKYKLIRKTPYSVSLLNMWRRRVAGKTACSGTMLCASVPGGWWGLYLCPGVDEGCIGGLP